MKTRGGGVKARKRDRVKAGRERVKVRGRVKGGFLDNCE